MANWQLHKGLYVPSYVQIEIRQFDKLKRQATVGEKVEQLPEETKRVVLKILEDWSA